MAIDKLLLACAGPVAVGTTGAFLLLTGGTSAEPAKGAWVDAPLSGSTLVVGQVVVQAHAAGVGVKAIDVEVDGSKVASATSLTSVAGLHYGKVTWTATVGHHVVVAIADGVRSAAADVTVTDEVPPGTKPSVTVTPSATPSPTATPTATPTLSATPSRSPSAAPSRTASPSAVATSASPRPQAPAISSASLSPRQVDHSDCGDYTPTHPSSTISVTTTGTAASAVKVVFTRSGAAPVTVVLTRSGSSWSGTVTADALDPHATEDPTTNDVWAATVTATGGGRSSTRSAGAITVQHVYCKP